MARSHYSDLARPPLSELALRRGLIVPGGLFTDVRVVAETNSTQADVVLAARGGAEEGLVVIAESQIAGRGRLDRRWFAPARAGITLSVLLRPGPRVPTAKLGWLPLLAGVALVEALERTAGVEAWLKWPNDVLVGPLGTAAAERRKLDEPGGPAEGSGPGGPWELGEAGGPVEGSGPGVSGASGALATPDRATPAFGKCAGILAEAVPTPAGSLPGPAVVLGIGLNVAQRFDELPPPIDPAAVAPTSLALVGATCTDRDPLVRALLRAVAGWYARWREAGADQDQCGLREAYRNYCHTIDRDVRVRLPGSMEVTGRACEVDGDGRLVVATADGVHAAVAAGDVVHLR